MTLLGCLALLFIAGLRGGMAQARGRGLLSMAVGFIGTRRGVRLAGALNRPESDQPLVARFEEEPPRRRELREPAEEELHQSWNRYVYQSPVPVGGEPISPRDRTTSAAGQWSPHRPGRPRESSAIAPRWRAGTAGKLAAHRIQRKRAPAATSSTTSGRRGRPS